MLVIPARGRWRKEDQGRSSSLFLGPQQVQGCPGLLEDLGSWDRCRERDNVKVMRLNVLTTDWAEGKLVQPGGKIGS